MMNSIGCFRSWLRVQSIEGVSTRVRCFSTAKMMAATRITPWRLGTGGRPSGMLLTSPLRSPTCTSVRSARFEAYGAGMDPEQLAEARAWRASFDATSLPKGTTVFSRSSGPGGQHVNKTESKATTTWPLHTLAPCLPKLLFEALPRASRYYRAGGDVLAFSAQTHRTRADNVAENHEKLAEELLRVYALVVPAESDPAKADKYTRLRKAARETRLQTKKYTSAKKNARKGMD